MGFSFKSSWGNFWLIWFCCHNHRDRMSLSIRNQFLVVRLCTNPGSFSFLANFAVNVYSLSHIRFFCNPIDCSPPSSSVHGSLQAKILEWVAISSCRGSSRPRDWTCVSYTAGGFLTTEPHGKPWFCPQITFLSQASFTQISNRKISMVAWGAFLHLSIKGVSKKQMKFWDRKLSENQVNFLFFCFFFFWQGGARNNDFIWKARRWRRW